MECLLQWLDDLDDLVAAVRLVAPALLPVVAVLAGAAALVAVCLWVPATAVAALAGSAALLAGAVCVRTFVTRSARRSIST